jgi:hypothetical protein
MKLKMTWTFYVLKETASRVKCAAVTLCNEALCLVLVEGSASMAVLTVHIVKFGGQFHVLATFHVGKGKSDPSPLGCSVFSMLMELSQLWYRQRTWRTVAASECNFTINLLKRIGHMMHQQFNIQQLYALCILYLCVLYLSQNKQRLVPLTA